MWFDFVLAHTIYSEFSGKYHGGAVVPLFFRTHLNSFGICYFKQLCFTVITNMEKHLLFLNKPKRRKVFDAGESEIVVAWPVEQVQGAHTLARLSNSYKTYVNVR